MNKAKDKQTMEQMLGTISAAMEAGTAPWQRSWDMRIQSVPPTNLTTSHEYSGMNRIFLSILGGMRGCDYWLGFSQAKKAGGSVRKGSKAADILRPVIVPDRDSADGDMKCIGFSTCRVFNALDVEGIELPANPEFKPREIDADALDVFVANTGADVAHGGDKACYIPGSDKVKMPPKDQFHTPGGYYGTLLHELTHWTGHKSRLDRLGDTSKRGYAFEELIAELGAYFTSERIGCPNEAENHASYLNSWLEAFKGDRRYLWDAAAKAHKASELLLKLGGQSQLAEAA